MTKEQREAKAARREKMTFIGEYLQPLLCACDACIKSVCFDDDIDGGEYVVINYYDLPQVKIEITGLTRKEFSKKVVNAF